MSGGGTTEPTRPVPEGPPDIGPQCLLDGRYRLGELIGRGGMAEVYRAEDTVAHRPVAIKLFRHDAAVPDEQARQDAEVRILEALSHRGVVRALGAGCDAASAEPRHYLVLELVAGPTLRQVIAAAPMPAGELARVGAQLAATLAYVHRRGVVHRDVKPANILLSRADGCGQVVARLTDFGVARWVDSGPELASGLTVGTANYLSPEQTRGETVTPASDVYSFGLVLIECLTGRMAFPGHGAEAAVPRLQRDPPIPAWVGPQWRRLLSAMTARRADERPSAAWVAQVLRGLAGIRTAASGTAAAAATRARPCPNRTTHRGGRVRPARRGVLAAAEHRY